MTNLQAEPEWGDSDEYRRLVSATYDARLAHFRTLGEPEADVWMPIINPAFRGGPEWPTRPAWQRIRADQQTLVASTGLSDPFADAREPNIGFGVETVVATADEVGADLRWSWLMEVAQTIAHQAAQDARFHIRHAKYGVFLFGVRMEPEFYQPFADAEGYCGFLIGLPIPGASTLIKIPSGEAVLLTAKLLTRREYEYVAVNGPEGAQRLNELFGRDGSHYLSSPHRVSVV